VISYLPQTFSEDFIEIALHFQKFPGLNQMVRLLIIIVRRTDPIHDNVVCVCILFNASIK